MRQNLRSTDIAPAQLRPQPQHTNNTGPKTTTTISNNNHVTPRTTTTTANNSK